jgi:TraL protein
MESQDTRVGAESTADAAMPFKVVFLDMDIAMLVGMIMMSGFLSQSYVPAMLAAGALGYGLHWLRTAFPRGFLTHFFVFWLLPPPFRALLATPPSGLREFVA